jgi:hypothetical protein
MTFNHLNFDELSDLIDDELPEEHKQYCKTHFKLCTTCTKEYEILTKYITLLSSCKNESITIPDFSDHVIMLCRSREKKRLYIKAIPAIAASIIIIIGAGFIKAGFFNETGTYINTNLTGHNEIQKIIQSISKSNGRIIQISHSFVDSEFDQSDLSTIERFLHNNKIKHVILVNPGILPNTSSGLIEDVNYSNNSLQGSMQDYNSSMDISILKSRKIRMRIFK